MMFPCKVRIGLHSLQVFRLRPNSEGCGERTQNYEGRKKPIWRANINHEERERDTKRLRKGDIIVSQTALICFANHEMELYN